MRRRQPEPTDPPTLMRRFVAFAWRLALGLAPVTAAQIGSLTTFRRRCFLAEPDLETFVADLRRRFDLSEPRRHLLELARRILDDARVQVPELVATFLELCAERGRDAPTLMAEGVLRAAARPFTLDRPARDTVRRFTLKLPTPADPRRAVFARLLAAFRLRLADRYARHLIVCFMKELAPGVAASPPDTQLFFAPGTIQPDSS